MAWGPASLGLVLLALGLSGCRALLKPSDHARQQSFASAAFAGDRTNAFRQTYFLLSGNEDCEVAVSQEPAGQGRATVNARWVSAEALAVGVEPDGYLLTVAHALAPRVYVLGWFDGQFGVRAARPVHTNQSNSLGADLAVIKVAAGINPCAILGEAPKAEDPVFAVVCYRRHRPKNQQAHRVIGFAGGSVLGVLEDPAGSPVALVSTKIPLWHGDSGGPLLSATGQLIGINTAYAYEFHGFYWKRKGIACLPHRAFLEDLIRRDRAGDPEPGAAPISLEIRNAPK